MLMSCNTSIVEVLQEDEISFLMLFVSVIKFSSNDDRLNYKHKTITNAKSKD